MSMPFTAMAAAWILIASPMAGASVQSDHSTDPAALQAILNSSDTTEPDESVKWDEAPADSFGDSGDGMLPQEQEGPGRPGRKRKSAKGGRVREANKETDGTQARDRFEATTAVKSKYESGGQPLEVDTD